MEKEYFETDTQITGFYGKKTMEDYIRQGGHGVFDKSRAERKREKERGKREKERRKREKERRKRKAVGATLEDVTEAEEERARAGEDVDETIATVNGDVREAPRGLKKVSKIRRVFTRRGTVA